MNLFKLTFFTIFFLFNSAFAVEFSRQDLSQTAPHFEALINQVEEDVVGNLSYFHFSIENTYLRKDYLYCEPMPKGQAIGQIRDLLESLLVDDLEYKWATTKAMQEISRLYPKHDNFVKCVLLYMHDHLAVTKVAYGPKAKASMLVFSLSLD